MNASIRSAQLLVGVGHRQEVDFDRSVTSGAGNRSRSGNAPRTDWLPIDDNFRALQDVADGSNEMVELLASHLAGRRASSLSCGVRDPAKGLLWRSACSCSPAEIRTAASSCVGRGEQVLPLVEPRLGVRVRSSHGGEVPLGHRADPFGIVEQVIEHTAVKGGDRRSARRSGTASGSTRVEGGSRPIPPDGRACSAGAPSVHSRSAAIVGPDVWPRTASAFWLRPEARRTVVSSVWAFTSLSYRIAERRPPIELRIGFVVFALPWCDSWMSRWMLPGPPAAGGAGPRPSSPTGRTRARSTTS